MSKTQIRVGFRYWVIGLNRLWVILPACVALLIKQEHNSGYLSCNEKEIVLLREG